MKVAYNSEVEMELNISSYYSGWDWFGNSKGKTGEEIFTNVTYGMHALISEKIQIKTGYETWNFDLEDYHNKEKLKMFKYNSIVPSPFTKFRNIYGGICFSFVPPDFLWKDGVRRIGVYLKKSAYVR